MNFQNVSDDELKQKIADIRLKLDTYEKTLDQEDNSVDRAAMRGEMTTLNHLKVEANRRGLQIN